MAAAAGRSAPGRQSATAHVQTRMTPRNLLLHMQHELGQRSRVDHSLALLKKDNRVELFAFGSQPQFQIFGRNKHQNPSGFSLFEEL
jgi:hypothetical protein